MNENDRRVRKTKQALYEALAKLMTEKELRYITVRELAETADIHRATFYSHYQDVYDLYEQLQNNVLSELDKIMDGNPTHSYHDVYKKIIDYVCENTEIWNMLFVKNSNSYFQIRVCELIEKKYLYIWLFEDSKTVITDKMRYLTSYHIQGCIAIINLWVKSGFSYSKEKVIELIYEVDKNIECLMI